MIHSDIKSKLLIASQILDDSKLKINRNYGIAITNIVFCSYKVRTAERKYIYYKNL